MDNDRHVDNRRNGGDSGDCPMGGGVFDAPLSAKRLPTRAIAISQSEPVGVALPIRRIKEEIGRALSRELRLQNAKAATEEMFAKHMEEFEACHRWARASR